MKTGDYFKAAVAALAILVLNVAIAFGVVAAYAHFIEPGREAAHYESAAERISPWSSVFFGALLFYLFASILGRRRPERPALAFAFVMFLVYAAIDLAVLFVAGAFSTMAGMSALSLLTKLAAAMLGARAATRR